MADNKTPTPMQRAEAAEALVTELNANIVTLKSERDDAVGKLTDALNEGTKLKGELAKEKSDHADTKAKLVTAESNFTTEKAAHETLKGGMETEIVKRASVEAAKIVAGQGLEDPLKTKVAGKPTDTEHQEPPKKGDYLTSLAAGAKADLERINGK